MFEMKNNLGQELIWRLDIAEEKISEFEHKINGSHTK